MTAPELEWPSNAWLTYADATKRWGLQTDPKTRNYVAVTPDTIALPLAEVKALMEALLKTIDDYHFYKLDEETRFGSRKALATLHERMK